MIQPGIFPFKLEITQEDITPRSGLILYAEVLRALRIRERIERYLPQPGSNREYSPSKYVEPHDIDIQKVKNEDLNFVHF